MILLYICLYVMALICNETRQGIWNACLNISGDLLHMMCLVMVSHYSNITWALCCLKTITLQWRHNEHDGVSNYWYLDYLLNRLFRCRSKKTSKLHVTGLCEGNPLVTGGFPSNAENYPIWWCHHDDSTHIGPVMWKAFPCHDITMFLVTVGTGMIVLQCQWNKSLYGQIKSN